MRDVLKNLFSNQITLEDNSQFYYTVKPCELTNALGNIIAVLQEYDYTKKNDYTGQFSCKLYKTKEGNWYEISNSLNSIDITLLMSLKLAVDSANNAKIEYPK